MKQPRVPQMREGEGGFLRELTLFLKDFCMEVWQELRRISARIDKIQSDIDRKEG